MSDVSIHHGETKRTLMGRSPIAGWGLFSGEKVKTGQFLGVLTRRCKVDGRKLALKRVNEGDCYSIKREYHFYSH